MTQMRRITDEEVAQWKIDFPNDRVPDLSSCRLGPTWKGEYLNGFKPTEWHRHEAPCESGYPPCAPWALNNPNVELSVIYDGDPHFFEKQHEPADPDQKLIWQAERILERARRGAPLEEPTE